MDTDINSYFEYVDGVITSSKIDENEKIHNFKPKNVYLLLILYYIYIKKTIF